MTNFEDWLLDTQARRTELDAYARSPLPTGLDTHGETNTLVVAEDDANRLAADAETFLIQYTAKAVMTIKDKYPDNSADERKILVKDAVRDIKRLADGISITARTINSRRFLMMNAARSR